MCSFIVVDGKIVDLDHVNHFCKRRGPDATTRLEANGMSFVHNILSITGQFSPQPFVSGNRVCVYNGQVYNYKQFGDYGSDGLCLLPQYERHGDEFVRQLDGEFAIALVDFDRDALLISTDVFATKPLWYSVGGSGNIAVSTYRSALRRLGRANIQRLKANTTLVFKMSTGELLKTLSVHDFDLHQHKMSCDDWLAAFERSIRKRTEGCRENVFIGLSSGYDSGAIACELRRQCVPFKAFTVDTTTKKAAHPTNPATLKRFEDDVVRSHLEDETVMRRRHELLKDAETLGDTRDALLAYLNDCVEEYNYDIYSSSTKGYRRRIRLQEDRGALGLALVCDRAKAQGYKIYLSGSGADEIICDYGYRGKKFFGHSNFGGLFPDDLSAIFPWPSFYESTMSSYLAKEEYVAGSYGIETRYPFLDKDVVQEFLWLHPSIKNGRYKSVIAEYMTRHNFPFAENRKTGF